MPWERDIELNLIVKEVEQENLDAAIKAAERRNKGKAPPMMKRRK